MSRAQLILENSMALRLSWPKLNCVNNNWWTEQVSRVTQQLSPLRYPLCDSRVPNALEKSAQHSYAAQKGLTRLPSHKHEGTPISLKT